MLTEICPLDECTGCASCASICPKQAIKMVADKHGFFHPEINQDQCVGCGLCVNTVIYAKIRSVRQIPN